MKDVKGSGLELLPQELQTKALGIIHVAIARKSGCQPSQSKDQNKGVSHVTATFILSLCGKTQ